MANNYTPKYRDKCPYCGQRLIIPTWVICEKKECAKIHAKKPIKKYV